MQRAVLYYESYEPMQGDIFSCFGYITQLMLHLVYAEQLHEHRYLQVVNGTRQYVGLMSLMPQYDCRFWLRLANREERNIP